MMMVHATIRKVAPSIKRRGLLARYATQKRRAVWMVPASEWERAVAHVLKHHRCSVSDVAIVIINPRRLILKHHGDGTYYVMGDVPPASIEAIQGLMRHRLL